MWRAAGLEPALIPSVTFPLHPWVVVGTREWLGSLLFLSSPVKLAPTYGLSPPVYPLVPHGRRGLQMFNPNKLLICFFFNSTAVLPCG